MSLPLDSGFIAQGNLKFGLLSATDGVTPVGYFGTKNAVKFEYNPGAPDLKTRKSKQIAKYGRILDQVAIPKVSEVTLTFDTVDADGIKTFLRGTASGLSVTGATITGATFAVAVLDLWLPIFAGRRFITAGSVLVKNTGDSTTYVEGTDYDIDYSMGQIIVYSTGAIVVGNVHITYAYGTYSGTSIAAETFTQLNCNVMFDGQNLANKKYLQVEVPKLVLAPSSALDFMSENFASLDLKGAPISVSGAAPLTANYITTYPAAFAN
jgi:hypothetical protein